MTELLQLSGVHAYRPLSHLHGVDVVPAHELTMLLGRNGCRQDHDLRTIKGLAGLL